MPRRERDAGQPRRPCVIGPTDGAGAIGPAAPPMALTRAAAPVLEEAGGTLDASSRGMG